jgi:integrase
LLRAEDWPEKRDTEPNPYTDGELTKMFASAGQHHLLLRFFLATGCREQEVAHAEFSDINYGKRFIQVQAKPEYRWSPKTDAGTRKIPLGDGLLADLRERGKTGLIFPNANTGRPEGHFLHIIKGIADVAGVAGAGCHRFRDTFATDHVRARVLDLRDIAKIMGHENMEMMKLYAAFVDLESDQARSAANASDRFASVQPKIVAIAS